MSADADSPSGTRSGFIALAGRPNVGKSTLANSIVGAKIAIVSDKPQTTRRAIRGVATGPDWQLVLVDLPGIQRPRDALTERMQRRVESELADADGCLLVLNAQQGIGPGDRFIAGLLSSAPVPVVIAVNKIDRTDRAKTAAVLHGAEELGIGEEIFPVSARTGEGVRPLTDQLISLLPRGPFYFEPRQRSDQGEGVLLGELVREQVLARTREEVPHAVEVEIEDIDRSRHELVRIEAVILVETESQKGILIGARGQMVKSIGVAARRAIERELGSRVHLELSVRVRRHWRADERLLDRLGIESRGPRAAQGHPRIDDPVDDSQIAFDERGLVPCIVQDWRSGEVLTLAYMNAQSLALTRETGEIHFYSRSRQELWHKGETSGHIQKVRAIRYDCDGDALLALVEPVGPACHTGERTCFHRGELEPAAPHEALPTLERTIAQRAEARPEGSYTATLLDDPGLAGAKVQEEAEEVVRAAREESDDRVAEEAADVVYHLAVLLQGRGLTLTDAEHVLDGRRKP